MQRRAPPRKSTRLAGSPPHYTVQYSDLTLRKRVRNTMSPFTAIHNLLESGKMFEIKCPFMSRFLGAEFLEVRSGNLDARPRDVRGPARVTCPKQVTRVISSVYSVTVYNSH